MTKLIRIMFAMVITLILVAPALPVAAQARQTEEAEWLVMLFQNADDPVLEEDIFMDLNEAELVGSTDDVVIV
ncbi:MAG: hypothetical protein M3Q45_12575, partial [Chloroflexota bacterium]|nr:hypothetical protein [Chloroflexota bacterium]